LIIVGKAIEERNLGVERWRGGEERGEDGERGH
jgi:hypothetical protein